MRIAFAGRLVPPVTGSELVMLELFRELVALDHQTHYEIFICQDDRAALVDYLPKSRVTFYSRLWRGSIGNILWHQLVLPALILRRQIDLLFTVQNRVPALRFCPQVVILHDMAEFRVQQKYDRLRNFYRKASLWIGARRADRVVTVSNSSRTDIVHYLNMAPEQIAVVPNGVRREFFVRVNCEQARAQLAGRYPVDEPYLLYVGALEQPNKNLLRMLQAYHCALATLEQPHRLLLAGPKRRAAELVFAEIERLDLSGRVQWLGYVPRVDLPLLYAGATGFVYVSLWEGFGLPVLEAMASGAPVIASNVSSLPEVVGEAGVLVDPTDVEAIAAAMVQLCNDKSLRQRLRRAGGERAGQFTWQRAAAQLLEVFHGVLLEGAS